MSARRRKPNYITWFFVVAVVAMAGYSYYDYRQHKKEFLAENEVAITTTSSDDFNEVLVKSKTETLQLKKVDSVWTMLQPVVDETDEATVGAFLSSIANGHVQKIREDGDTTPIAWEKYGLAPGVVFEITTDKGAKETFSVSDSNAFDGSFYIRKGDQLYLGDRAWAHIADKQVSTLRSHRIWRGEGAVTEAHLHYDYGGKVEDAVFTKDKDGNWKVLPTYDLPVSSDKMMQWFDEFKDLRAMDFAAPSLQKGDDKKFYLTKPSMKIQMKLKQDEKESSAEWTIGQDQDDSAFVVSSQRPDVFKVSKFSIRNLRVPVERLLDVTEILKFPVEEARDVLIKHDGQSLHLVKGEKDWTFDPPPTAGTFDMNALAEFFQRLQGLEPIGDVPPAGIAYQPGKDEITISGKDGKILFHIAWSNEKEMLRWLKVGKLKEEFKVSGERLNGILRTTFKANAKTKAKDGK